MTDKTLKGGLRRRDFLATGAAAFALGVTGFPAVLRAFLARSPVALTLVNSSRWVPYAELAALHACVLLPWDPATMAFYELQALNVPTAVPDPAFLLRVREGTEPSLAFCATL